MTHGYFARTQSPNSPWTLRETPSSVGIAQQVSSAFLHQLLVAQPGVSRHEQASVWNVPTPVSPTPTTPSIPAEHASSAILHNAQIAFSAGAVRVTPMDQIRGTLAILANVLYFTPDPAEIERRERKVAFYDEKIAAGRAGENVARLLGEIRGEEQKLALLTSEEFRSYRVGENRGDSRPAARNRGGIVLRVGRFAVLRVRFAGGSERIPHGASLAVSPAVRAVPRRNGRGAVVT